MAAVQLMLMGLLIVLLVLMTAMTVTLTDRILEVRPARQVRTISSVLYDRSCEIEFVCISMEHRRASHFQALEGDLMAQGLPVRWFKGIVGSRLDLDDFRLSRKYRRFFEDNQREREAGRTQVDHRGHLGCTLSHLAVLRASEGPTVVLEDDAKIVPDFRQKLEATLAALNKLDSSWELLLLGLSANYGDHPYHKLNDREPIHPGGLVRVHYWIGGWSYLVRDRAAADKIVGFFDPIDWHIDLTMAEQARLGNLKVYATVPTLSNHQGYLRLSSWDYNQYGDHVGMKSDTNNPVPDWVR